MDQDTIHLLFPNLNKLLNFQRKFLIRLEGTAELPWQDQRWGQHFLENVSVPNPPMYPIRSSHCRSRAASFPVVPFQEDEFVVYEPYCANYTNATELMLANEQNLVVSLSLFFPFPCALFSSVPFSSLILPPPLLGQLVVRFTPTVQVPHLPDNLPSIASGIVRVLTKQPSIASEPLDQRQGRAARFAYQADPAHLQISPSP